MRLENWEENLEKTFEIYKNRDFKWGEVDCVLFVNDCIKAVTGIDVRKDNPGDYYTELQAVKFVKKLGGGGILELAKHFAEKYNWKEISAAAAHKGDLVVFEGFQLGPTMGIISLNAKFIASISLENGLCFIPRTKTISSWKIE